MRTVVGRDWQAGVMSDTGSTGTGDFAPANWMAFTEDPTAPAAGDEALASEISSGSLARAQAVFAHTGGSASYTLTRAITADQEVTLRKLGIFTADAPGGIMVFESAIPDPPAMVPGDQIQITHTIQL